MYWPKAGLLVPGTGSVTPPGADIVQRLPVMCSYCAEKALPGLDSGMSCWRKKYHYKFPRFNNTTICLQLYIIKVPWCGPETISETWRQT